MSSVGFSIMASVGLPIIASGVAVGPPQADNREIITKAKIRVFRMVLSFLFFLMVSGIAYETPAKLLRKYELNDNQPRFAVSLKTGERYARKIHFRHRG
jgi:hypothetical protein